MNIKKPSNPKPKTKPFVTFSVLMFILFSFCCSCAVTVSPKYVFENSRPNLPIKSFIFIQTELNINICPKGYKSDSECNGITASTSGSGSIVYSKTNDFSLILTAAHVCVTDHVKKMLPPSFVLKDSKTTVYDIDGTKFETSVFSVDKDNDICLIKSKFINRPVVPFSPVAPVIGDKVYNIAAPAGIFSKNMVPIYEGYFSGDYKEKIGVYSIFSYGGSSGSMIINHYGQLIGMIHSGFSEMNNISLSPTYDILKNFLNTSFSSIK